MLSKEELEAPFEPFWDCPSFAHEDCDGGCEECIGNEFLTTEGNNAENN